MQPKFPTACNRLEKSFGLVVRPRSVVIVSLKNEWKQSLAGLSRLTTSRNGKGDDPPILESLVGRFRLRKGAGSLGQTAKKSVHGILLLIGERVLIDTAHAHAFTNCHVRVHIWT